MVYTMLYILGGFENKRVHRAFYFMPDSYMQREKERELWMFFFLQAENAFGHVVVACLLCVCAEPM